MHRHVISSLLFHCNLMIFFLFGFRECIILFISVSVVGIIFMLGMFVGNEYFRVDIASPCYICWMFNVSVIVIKKLLKALAMFVVSFNFSSFTSTRKPVPLNVLALLFLYNIPCCFYFVIRFSYKSTVVLLLTLFYDFS